MHSAVQIFRLAVCLFSFHSFFQESNSALSRSNLKRSTSYNVKLHNKIEFPIHFEPIEPQVNNIDTSSQKNAKETRLEKRGLFDGFLGRKKPEPEEEAPEEEGEDDDQENDEEEQSKNRGWFGFLSSEKKKKEEVSPSKSSARAGWFGFGAPAAEEKPKKSEKPKVGFLRSIYRTAKLVVPRTTRKAIKSVPGVRPVHGTFKAATIAVDNAIDSVVDNDYLKNIGSASKLSAKRVALKSVNLADSMLDLGTGTSEAAINLMNVMQEEGAKSLDSMNLGLGPLKTVTDAINDRSAQAVKMMYNCNDLVRKYGKAAVGKIKCCAGLNEVEESKPETSSGSWFW